MAVSSRLLVLLVALVVSGLAVTETLARREPPVDAAPGAVGIAGVTLGSIEPAVTPGYRLDMVELVWEPDAYATRHFHPTALITCVRDGALGFTLDAGAATLIRGGTPDAPGEPEAVAVGEELVLEPRDCIAFDEFASHMEHTGWNAAEGSTVLWEARLLDPGQPFTTYVDEHGTPVP